MWPILLLYKRTSAGAEETIYGDLKHDRDNWRDTELTSRCIMMSLKTRGRSDLKAKPFDERDEFGRGLAGL